MMRSLPRPGDLDELAMDGKPIRVSVALALAEYRTLVDLQQRRTQETGRRVSMRAILLDALQRQFTAANT